MTKPLFWILPFADHQNYGSGTKTMDLSVDWTLFFLGEASTSTQRLFPLFALEKTRITSFSFLWENNIQRLRKLAVQWSNAILHCCSNNLWGLQVIFTAWPTSIPCGLQTYSLSSHSLYHYFVSYIDRTIEYKYISGVIFHKWGRSWIGSPPRACVFRLFR